MTTEPTRYRQQPRECDAIQWTGSNADKLRAFAGADFDTINPADRIDDPDCDAQLLIEDSHWVAIRPTDWVLKFDGYFVAKADKAFRAVWESAPPTAETPDTLPEWLYQRFARYRRHAPAWSHLTDDDRAYWEHEAAAVRRAVARGGFKTAADDGSPAGEVR